MRMKISDLLLSIYCNWGGHCWHNTNSWIFNPTKRLFNFFNEHFGVASWAFGILMFSGGMEMEQWTKMGFKTLSNTEIKSNQTIYSFTWFLQILVCTSKNKMAKSLQWKIMCGETTCKETLYKPRPRNTEIKNKLN